MLFTYLFKKHYGVLAMFYTDTVPDTLGIKMKIIQNLPHGLTVHTGQ
jgi:hypothetical protein